MHPDRIKIINKDQYIEKKQYILYWMQQSQRIHYNHALQYAIQLANQKNVPLLVYFALDANYPDANLRHFTFMIEGIKETQALLSKLGISFVIEIGNPIDQIMPYLANAYSIVCDMGYTRIQRKWRQDLFQIVRYQFPLAGCFMIESDLIVPIHKASEKCEYGAYTIRPKLMKQYLTYRDFKQLSVISNQKKVMIQTPYTQMQVDQLLDLLDLDRSVEKSPIYRGGYLEASKMFHEFITHHLNDYLNSSDPSKNGTSKMSMYLHFGQISSLELLERLILSLSQNQISQEVFDAYIEQLLVRRELAFNFIYYREHYDSFEDMTEPWAYQTMNQHKFDDRPIQYSLQEIEEAKTEDKYFNVAMQEMSLTGFMQNYMRMYWAKKIIEWTKTHEEAYERIKYLNNKYFIDGRDANSYTGIAWCFGKHDRPWQERTIFGKLRYMNAAGLERKFDMISYIDFICQFKKHNK